MQNSAGVDPGGPGLRERQKRARREALIDATHRLVAEHGLDAITVEAICDEAGVSVRTFFNYFETKDDAVLGHTPWPLESAAVDEFMAGGPTGHLLEDLQVLAASFLGDPHLDHGRMARAFELAAQEPRLIARHLAWLEKHKGQLATIVDGRMTRASTSAGYSGETVAATLMFLLHATFLRTEASSADVPVGDHLDTVVAELRAIVSD
ncbi:TetR/AcrR family transcriptional regulator [Cellulomonas sp. URHE0023]|uniref:TetR/AcrR family transcriptional regulator n=1 Tax=Cellulomonas sp. URHE0023 TaxID=1380354 RepID=UPI0005519760|nr:TetR/AcrR family transcriptional regulator [Cellulomonas sp. URHE0023]